MNSVGGTTPSDINTQIDNLIFLAFVNSSRSSMKFENFVSLYATLACPQGDEQAELAFRMYATTPPEKDIDKQEEYI